MPTPSTSLLVEWIDKITSSGVNLSTWDTQFIDSMQNKVEMYGDRVMFTPKQAEQIERIFSEKVP